jgi:iron complex outermembrane receptor protein
MSRSTASQPRPGFGHVLLLALAGWLFVGGLPASAQTGQDPAPVATAAAEEADEAPVAGGQEEIVVTARKREENVQDVPVAVSVLTGAAMEDKGASDITELQAEVPNLSIYSGRNQSTTLTVFMRGIGQADPLWGVDPGVGLYLDDVYVARPQGALLDVYDLQRIEVLRGPQGTLYGKNTIGGAIKYISRELTDDFGGSVSFSPGSYGNQDFRAAVGGALVAGKLRAKVAVASLQHDGYGKNLFTGRDVSDKDTLAYRLAFDWLASDTVKVQLSYDHTKDDAEPKGHTRLAANPLCPLFLGGQACPPEANIFDTRSGLAPVNSTDAQGGAITVSWDLSSAWRLKSITAHRKSDSENNIDFDTTPARIADVAATYYDKQTSEEIQAIFDGGGKFNGVFGAFYFDGKAGGLVKNIFVNRLFGTTDGYTKTKSYALFGDGSYRFTDRLTFNFGLRGTSEKKNGVAFNAGYTDDTFTHVSAVTAQFDKSKTFTSLAPRLGVDYHFSQDVMGYVTASRGFKSGGYNVRAQATVFPESAEPFDDEVLTVAEVGVKSLLADHSLVLNLATFYGKYKDIQVSTFTAYDSNGDGVEDAFFGNFLNAGNATMKGAELEFDWSSRAISWLGFAGNVSYLDLAPDEFLDANRDHFVDTQVITNAPKLTGTLRANVHFPAFGGVINASASVSHRDESTLTNEGGQYPGRPGTPLLPLVQPAYESYDASIGWLSPAGTWRLAVNGKNLSDEEYLTNGYNIPSLGVLQGSYGAPRTVLGTVEYRF